MQTTLTRFSHVILTAHQYPHLLTNLVQPPQHFTVPIDKPQDRVRDPRLIAKLAHKNLHLAKIVPGHAGKQVMHSLKLQAAVDKIEPRGAVNVHGGAKLALGKRLILAQVRRGHAPVGKGDLHVQRHRDNVRDEHVEHAGAPVRQRAPEQPVAKEEPVAAHKDNLRRADPPRLAAAELRRLEEDVDPREKVQVEAGDAHDGVVRVLLPRHEHVGGAVPDKGKVIVCGTKGLEEGRAGGKKRNVLNIRVMLLDKEKKKCQREAAVETRGIQRRTGWLVMR